ncbi:sensor histidine kinase [Cellulomonas sp. APG4]|uniref:sensor histidine kinase n=1 Tax=Cellulomonas sp. APG4 TaxID=1538656 RepID=UPI00137B90EC|nr:histidine kinase [Cellulomonas sp. APG4]NCT90512.1 sensor histidine kinase [Cellulomonas sp. APG4]
MITTPWARNAQQTAQLVAEWLAAPLRTREAPEPFRTRLGRRAPWIAVGAAVLVLLFGVDAGPAVQASDAAETVTPAFGAVELSTAFTAVIVGLLGWRPLLAWRAVWVVTLLWTLLGTRPGIDVFLVPGAMLAALIAGTVVVAVRHSRQVGWGAIAWTAALLVLGTSRADGTTALVLVIGLGLVGLLIDARRQRSRAKAEAAREREARVTSEAESLVLEERARIARDLHDVVAHHMSMVAVQAETAQYRLGGVEEPVRDEFHSIARAARAALSDVRGILTVLRDADAEVERAPQPGLDGLEALVEAARSVGTEVDLAVVGDRRALAAALEIGAYRIVQEALANAARHAPGAAVAVVVGYRERELEVTVTNGPPPSGPSPNRPSPGGAPSGTADDGAAPAGGGHGLVGMRERAHLLGGEVTASPTPDGGFRVAATLPAEVAVA